MTEQNKNELKIALYEKLLEKYRELRGAVGNSQVRKRTTLKKEIDEIEKEINIVFKN